MRFVLYSAFMQHDWWKAYSSGIPQESSTAAWGTVQEAPQSKLLQGLRKVFLCFSLDGGIKSLFATRTGRSLRDVELGQALGYLRNRDGVRDNGNKLTLSVLCLRS